MMSERQFDSLSFRKAFEQADIPGKVALCLSTWFGTGLLPKAPGTFGTLGGAPLLFGMQYLGTISTGVCIGVFVLIAIWSSGLTQRILGRHDPSEVVIDEAAGLLLTFFLVPLSWGGLILGFILFRLFDIFKPFPIKRLEKISGGKGIVLDDLLAGLYANLALRVILFLI